MSSSPRLLGVVAVAICIVCGPVAAQDTDASREPVLSRTVMQSSTILSDLQRQDVDQYVEYWVGELIKGADDRVPHARAKIDEPFRAPGATKMFLSAYSVSVSGKLGGAIAPPDRRRVVTRLNAMLTVRNVTDARVGDLIRMGLDDPNSAVRYLAAKAVGVVGQSEEVSEAQKTAILLSATRTLRSERDQLVVGQLLLGLLGLADMREARVELLEAINRRVDEHANQPNMALDGDTRALRELFRGIVQRNATPEDLPAAEATLLAQVAFRLMDVSATVLDEQRAEEGMDRQYRKLYELCDTILRWLAGGQEASGSIPAKDTVRAALLNKRHDQLAEFAARWRQLLTAPPFDIDARRLQVQFR